MKFNIWCVTEPLRYQHPKARESWLGAEMEVPKFRGQFSAPISCVRTHSLICSPDQFWFSRGIMLVDSSNLLMTHFSGKCRGTWGPAPFSTWCATAWEHWQLLVDNDQRFLEHPRCWLFRGPQAIYLGCATHFVVIFGFHAVDHPNQLTIVICLPWYACRADWMRGMALCTTPLWVPYIADPDHKKIPVSIYQQLMWGGSQETLWGSGESVQL